MCSLYQFYKQVFNWFFLVNYYLTTAYLLLNYR
jgi:hypothetical protein